jgi:selenocysteine lyase/cysteine desulfurase
MERLMGAINAGNISVSIRGSAIRISPHVYNDEDDLAALAGAFRSAAPSGRAHSTSII